MLKRVTLKLLITDGYIFKRMALKLVITKGQNIWKNVINVVITEGWNTHKNGVSNSDYARWKSQRARLYCVVIQRYFAWGNLYSSYPTFLLSLAVTSLYLAVQKRIAGYIHWRYKTIFLSGQKKFVGSLWSGTSWKWLVAFFIWRLFWNTFWCQCIVTLGYQITTIGRYIKW